MFFLSILFSQSYPLFLPHFDLEVNQAGKHRLACTQPSLSMPLSARCKAHRGVSDMPSLRFDRFHEPLFYDLPPRQDLTFILQTSGEKRMASSRIKRKRPLTLGSGPLT